MFIVSLFGRIFLALNGSFLVFESSETLNVMLKLVAGYGRLYPPVPHGDTVSLVFKAIKPHFPSGCSAAAAVIGGWGPSVLTRHLKLGIMPHT